MTILYLNGVAVPTPIKYDVSLADIQASNSGRNDAGIMSMEVVRKDVATVNVGWDMLNTTELETISMAISFDEIPVKFYYGDYKEAIMYKGDRKVDLKCQCEDGPRWSMSFSLIEY
jgi:hypothetical protein